jgi:hypothetical protein
MADPDNTTVAYDIPFLTFAGARLAEHGDNYTAAANDLLTVIANDLRLAARVFDRLASLRFAIGEVITKIEAAKPQAVEGAVGASAEPQTFTRVDITRELRAALEKAAREV